MYSFKEKKTHFVALRNPDVAQYDLELLAKEVPGFPQLATFSRNPKRYADDILYALLDCATREKIREYRRAMIAKEAEGFVYCVSSLGVTGMRSQITTDIGAMVQLVKAQKDIPCAVGFGISTPEQAKKIAK